MVVSFIVFMSPVKVFTRISAALDYAPPHPRTPRGSQFGREKRRDERFQVLSKEPLAALIRVNTTIGDMNVMKQSAMTQPL